MMDRIDAILIFITILTLVIVYYEIIRNQSLQSSLNHEDRGEILLEVDSFSNLQLAQTMNFPLIIHLAHQILLNSQRYRSKIIDRESFMSFIETNRSEDVINVQMLDSIITKIMHNRENNAITSTRRIKKLFYLKTHKTGSSTLNNIIWRSLCLIRFEKENETLQNCFLPRKENPGKTWSSKDFDSLSQLKGTTGSGAPFDVWNAHVKINILAYFQQNRSVLASQISQNDSYLNSTTSSLGRDKTFEDFIFSRLIPNPELFISMVRRPSHRFESAFHWYDLSDNYDSIQNQFSGKYLKQERQFHQSMGPSLRSATQLSQRKKNRFNPTKFKNSQNSSTLSSTSLHPQMTRFQEFLEDVAWEVIDKLWSRANDYCAYHIQSLSMSRDHCYQLFFARYQQSAKNDGPGSIDPFSLLCKELIDEILLAFEKIFHHRSGFQSSSKELLNSNQFGEGFHQKKFERSFEQLISALVSYRPSYVSNGSLPGQFRVPSLYLFNLDDLPKSILVFQSLLESPSFLPLLSLPQKQQNYMKLSSSELPSHLYYQFLDLLQYYDSYLYRSQQILSRYLLKELRVPSPSLIDYTATSTWLIDRCSDALISQDLKRIKRDNITAVAHLLGNLVEQEVKLRRKPLELLKNLSHMELISLCLLYSLDNHNYVEYFHSD